MAGKKELLLAAGTNKSVLTKNVSKKTQKIKTKQIPTLDGSKKRQHLATLYHHMFLLDVQPSANKPGASKNPEQREGKKILQ